MFRLASSFVRGYTPISPLPPLRFSLPRRVQSTNLIGVPTSQIRFHYPITDGGNRGTTADHFLALVTLTRKFSTHSHLFATLAIVMSNLVLVFKA